jgi:GT2 family glycosyltransferase
MDEPTVTAIVVTFNSERIVADCLSSLRAAAPDMPIVVVDNASHDRTADIVGRHPSSARLVPTGVNGGYAAAINIGARHAAGAAALLVVNPDVRVERSAIAHLRDALTSPGTGIAVPRILEPDGATAHSLRRRPTLLRAWGEALLGGHRAGRLGLGEIVCGAGRYARPGVVDTPSGAAMLVDRRCHDALGGWDESYFLYSEETDLCRRAGELGWATRYEPTAVVTHIGGHGERTALRALMVDNRAVQYRRRHGPVATAAFRAALAVNEGLRIRRSPHHAAALRQVLGLGVSVGRPGVSPVASVRTPSPPSPP